MGREAVTQTQQSTSHPLTSGGILQRQCGGCGVHAIAAGECESCQKKKIGFQRKLAIGSSNDPLEREADRIADQVMTAPAHPVVSGAPLRIQRYVGQGIAGADTAPASVDRVLSTPGRPLDPALQQDMGQRFGHDFSQVRVHTGTAAERSAQEVKANAYTVGHNIVFGTGQFKPDTHKSRWLLAHELAHVLQQSSLSHDRTIVQRDAESTAETVSQPSSERPSQQREEVDQLDYAFVFTGGSYGQAAEAFIRQYYPQHRLIRSTSFEEMFDQLFTDTRRTREGHRFHLRELVIVTHANAAGGLRIPLTRGDVARQRFFTIWDVDDLQEEFQADLHRRFRQRRHELVGTIIDEDTTVLVRGCEFGQAGEALEVLGSLFGGQPTVWAPRAYQGYETILIGSDLLRTPEEAFDFLMQQDFLPPELMPLPDEEKRDYIARVFGLHGSIPAEFFVVGPDARARLGSLISRRRGISREAEAEKVREPATIPSGGEFWGWSSPRFLGDDAELDHLSMREIAERTHALMNPYSAENACIIARLRRAWERKETSNPYWMDFLVSETNDPLAGLPGETASFFAYMANRFRANPSSNPFDGLPIEDLFGDSNLITIDAAQHPCRTPHEDIFETQMLEHEIPTQEARTDAGTFEEPPAVAPPRAPAATESPQTGETAESPGRSSRSEALTARARALDFSKSSQPVGSPSLAELLQRLSNEDLIQAYGLALELAAGGDHIRLTAVEAEMARRLLIGPNGGVSITSISEAEFEAMTGVPAASIPEQTAMTGGPGVGVLFIPQPNWYYRVLQSHDPSISGIQSGADLLPRQPNPGSTFQPAASRAEMTFRHTRPGGNVPQVGTDRISTARSLEAFETILRERGTGEMVRVDVPAARRMGTEFLEYPDIHLDLEQMEQAIQAELEQARQAGRGSSYISRIESRLRAVQSARQYTATFQEGEAIGRVPSQSITPVEGATLSEAAAGERALLRNIRYLRWGGRVLVFVGAVLSIHRVATASPEQRPRVAAQEAGGWAFSLGSAWAGAQAGGLVGGALGVESGPGLLITGGVGAVIGAVTGFFVGERAADWIYDLFR